MAKLKMEPGMTTVGQNAVVVSAPGGMVYSTAGPILATSAAGTALQLTSMDCYEDMFKEITKKLYGEEAALAEVIDSTGAQNIVFDDGTLGSGGFQLITATNANGLPPGTIVLQRRVADDKGLGQAEQVALTTVVPSHPIEERWFESEDTLNWTTSKIARYNPAQKVFRCVDCDFVGFLSRVAEHWLGNHASLRVFQCPRCPYTSAWARCVRMHLTRQHGESLTDNSLWKENPVLEEVTKFLTSLKTRVEQKGESMLPGEKRYTCQYCSYATDRRDLFNRHENIHRDEKPFQCYVCEKQFNRADHVKKHFTRMHRDSAYDINRIKKHIPKVTTAGGITFYSSSKTKHSAVVQSQQNQESEAAEDESLTLTQTESGAVATMVQTTTKPVQVQNQATNSPTTAALQQQIPHIAYFNPPSTPGQTGPLQGIQGVGGNKKEPKPKGIKKKKQGEKMYTCSYCPWQGVDNWCLKRHLNTHIKPFLCALCDYKAARSERLATHVLKVHNKRVCHKCSFLADDTDSLNQHIQDSHQNPLVKTGFNCNICQEYFEQRADLESHAILEHQKVIVQCDLCDFRTTDELSMEAHLRDKHNLQPGMGAVAAAAAAAAAAVGISQQSMQLAVQPSLDINDGMDVEVPEPTILHIPGDQDGMDELSYDPDTSPSQKNGGEDSMTLSELADAEGAEEEEYEEETLCEACGCEFSDEHSLRNHQKRHRLRCKGAEPRPVPIDKRNSRSITRSYTCSTCSFNSATSKAMMQHQRTHSGFEVSCWRNLCSFKSAYDNSLKEHILSEHKDDPMARCPHCGCKLASMNDFTVHWRNHHLNLCGLCVNVYRTKYNVKDEGVHEIVVKTPADIMEEELAIEKEFEAAQTQDVLEDLDGPPPVKKIRMDMLSTGKTVSNYFNHESIRFLPKFEEVKVTRIKIPKRMLEPGEDPVKWKSRSRSSSARAQRGSPFLAQFLNRRAANEYATPKCHRPSCHCRGWRYSRRSNFVLHRLWRHREQTQCDICNAKFSTLAQAYLHKRRAHPESFIRPKSQPQNQNRVGHQTTTDTQQILAIFKHEHE